MTDGELLKRQLEQCWFCKVIHSAMLGICTDCRDHASDAINGRTLQFFGDWAMILDMVYPITGRGWSYSGPMLYGKPRMTDELCIAYGSDNSFTSKVKGVDRYCISGWNYPGAMVGILLDDVIDIRTKTTCEMSRDYFNKGTLVLGRHVT